MRVVLVAFLISSAAAADNSYGDEPVVPEAAPAAPATNYAESAPVVVAEKPAETTYPAPAPAVENSGYRFKRQSDITKEFIGDHSSLPSLMIDASADVATTTTAASNDVQNSYGDEAVVPSDAALIASAPKTQTATEAAVTELPVAQMDQGYVAAVVQPAVDSQSAAGYRIRRNFVAPRRFHAVRRVVRVARPSQMHPMRFFIRPETLRAARMARMRKMRKMRMLKH